jgi:hypothetical protein
MSYPPPWWSFLVAGIVPVFDEVLLVAFGALRYAAVHQRWKCPARDRAFQFYRFAPRLTDEVFIIQRTLLPLISLRVFFARTSIHFARKRDGSVACN